MDASYLSQQVNSIIGQLHGLFDEIGVPSHDRETREAEVCHVMLPNLQPTASHHPRTRMLTSAFSTTSYSPPCPRH